MEKKLDKSKMTLEQHAMVEQLETLSSAGESLKKIAESMGGKSSSTIEIKDNRVKEIAPVLEAISNSILAIKRVKELDAKDIVTPIVTAVERLKITLEGKKFDVSPVVNVSPTRVDVPTPQVTVDLTRVSNEIKKLKTEPLSAVSDDGGKIYLDGQAYEPQHSKIDVTDSGVTKIVDSDKTIHVISCFLMASDATEIQILSGGIISLSGYISLMPSTGFVLPYNSAGWMRAGESLDIEQRGNARIGGLITYIEV